MRTNIEIDDELMKEAMAATGAPTKKAAVEAALRKLIEVRSREEAFERAFQEQEKSRQLALHQGRMAEWQADLIKNGTPIKDPLNADQY